MWSLIIPKHQLIDLLIINANVIVNIVRHRVFIILI